MKLLQLYSPFWYNVRAVNFNVPIFLKEKLYALSFKIWKKIT